MKPSQILKKGKNYRKSVCAEVYGKYNPIETVETEYHLKTDEEKENLTTILKQKFMFKNLNDDDFEIIIHSFKKNNLKEGDLVIK